MLNFQYHYSSLQCHMILQRLFCWFAAQEIFLIITTVENCFFWGGGGEDSDTLVNRKFKNSVYLNEIFCDIKNKFTVNFVQFTFTYFNFYLGNWQNDDSRSIQTNNLTGNTSLLNKKKSNLLILIINYAPAILPSSASAFGVHISNSNQQQMHGAKSLPDIHQKMEEKICHYYHITM